MLHLFSGVFERQEPMRIEALRTELPVDRLDEGVIRGLAGAREVERDVVLVRPQIEVAGDELRSLIDADRLRIADALAGLFERSNDILAALYTGGRSGELLNLRVSDVGREGYGVSVAPLKTRTPRFVFLPDEGMAFFLRLAAGRDSNAPSFLRKNGMERGAQHRFYFRLAVAAAALPKEFTFHGLRHTYASQLIQAGTPLQAVADPLGHSNTTIVSRTYAHFAPQILEAEIRQRFRGIDPAMKRQADRMRHELKSLRAAIYGGDGSAFAEIADLKSRRRDRDKLGVIHPRETPELVIPYHKVVPTRGACGKTVVKANRDSPPLDSSKDAEFDPDNGRWTAKLPLRLTKRKSERRRFDL